MKKVSFVVALLFLFTTWVPTHAQTGVTGIWQTLGVTGAPWTIELRTDGPRLTGTGRQGNGTAVEIYEGKIEGNTIAFKLPGCPNPPCDRIITFAGTVSGDEILFTRDVEILAGGVRGGNGLFGGGTGAVREFTAKRVLGITFDRILHADQEPQNWLTYSGTVRGQRYSPLSQITPANVGNLELAWFWQAQSDGRFEATALAVDGIVYTVHDPNDVIALDGTNGRVLWTYSYTPAAGARASGGGGRPNRGLAILGDTLFMGTLDAHLLAINASTGKLIWNTTVADFRDPACKGGNCYVITHAPQVVKDKVIVGTAGGDDGVGAGIRGFIAAFNVTTGKEVWRFYTIPAGGEPGNETWSGDSWKIGGGGVWNTGAYDPDLNLTYWGTGNPNPTRSPELRLGDNLYTDSVVALDADTGRLKWHYQFTPHDYNDWDAAQVPVLADIEWQGRPRKVMLWANRNGFMYVLDRTTGQFLMGKPFVEVNWMSGFDDRGRPVGAPPETGLKPGPSPTNWKPPSYSQSTGLFYIPSWERGNGIRFGSGPSYSAMRAFDPRTGEKKWEFKRNDAVFSGALTTASDVLFTGTEGDSYSEPTAASLAGDYLYALDARTGEILWHMGLAGSVSGGPMSYSVGGKQFITVTARNTLFAFALRVAPAAVDSAPQAAQPATTPSLVGYWKFDEGSGTTLTDSSGYGNNGTLVNGVAWTAGKLNGALNFDGADDYVNLGGPGSSNFGIGDFSISFWARTSQVTTKNDQWPETLSKNNKEVDRIDTGFEFFWGNSSWNNGKMTFKTTSGGASRGATSSITTNDGQWHHYVGVRSPSSVELFIDGVSRGSVPAQKGSVSNAAPLRLGAMEDGAWSGFAGSIDEVRIYRGTLSASDIQSLYIAGGDSHAPSAIDQAR